MKAAEINNTAPWTSQAHFPAGAGLTLAGGKTKLKFKTRLGQQDLFVLHLISAGNERNILARRCSHVHLEISRTVRNGACDFDPAQASKLDRNLDRRLSLRREDRSVEQILATGIELLGPRVSAHQEERRAGPGRSPPGLARKAAKSIYFSIIIGNSRRNIWCSNLVPCATF